MFYLAKTTLPDEFFDIIGLWKRVEDAPLPKRSLQLQVSVVVIQVQRYGLLVLAEHKAVVIPLLAVGL